MHGHGRCKTDESGPEHRQPTAQSPVNCNTTISVLYLPRHPDLEWTGLHSCSTVGKHRRRPTSVFDLRVRNAPPGAPDARAVQEPGLSAGRAPPRLVRPLRVHAQDSTKNTTTPPLRIAPGIQRPVPSSCTWLVWAGTSPVSTGTTSDDAKILLTLLAFLKPTKTVSCDLLLRGATPRGRWTAQGEIEDVDAVSAGLVPELAAFLSDPERVNNAFSHLHLPISAERRSCTPIAVAGLHSIHDSLPPELVSLWRSQALIVAYRAIPWKSIEAV